MRIKISTNSPLPPLKAWFPFPSLPDEGPTSPFDPPKRTIYSLKYLICATLPDLSFCSPSHLRLTIDGFELLDECALTVVRDGDLICIDQVVAPNGSVPFNFGKKAEVKNDRSSAKDPKPQSPPRTRSDLPSTSVAAKKRKRRSVSSSSSESEEESSSSESESESSSESASSSSSESSDSDSDSDSDSSSDASTPRTTPSLHRPVKPQEQPKAKPPQKLKQSVPQAAQTAHLVPPGHGKPQTRSRNLRRRLKNQYDREAAAASSEAGPVSGSNAIVAGTANSPAEEGVPGGGVVTPDAPDATANRFLTLPSLSLRNKNKAKNFKALIGKPLPPKIIFADLEAGTSAAGSGSTSTSEPTAPVAGSSKSQTSIAAPQQPTPRALPPLIPPSSRPSLPSNLFVTSIDVEAGLRRPRKKRKMRVEYGETVEEDPEYHAFFEAAVTAGPDNVDGEGDITLDYGGETTVNLASESTSQGNVSDLKAEVDVAALESFANKNWSNLTKITREEQVTPGRMIGYKALGINPTTFTPEYLLTLVKVVSFDVGSAWKKLVVRPLQPRAEVSFSGPFGGYEEGGDGELEDEHSWDDVVSGDWRVIERS
ncbi:hypothetical protein HYDPIDRAFT_31729 [Hydnomerulius pinastri MD-312]|uniref:Coilin n=1 Tax=Hydnomerulius pinastri MD-312 TaxID=994086 RepID=A0A0C9WBA2_9AGAM|nr:hypothetical protein HYDPIDRAFT_31729 [Hydnomerulius pinastri MD-312]